MDIKLSKKTVFFQFLWLYWLVERLWILSARITPPFLLPQAVLFVFNCAIEMMQNDLERQKPVRNRAREFHGYFFHLSAPMWNELDFETELALRLNGAEISFNAETEILFHFPQYAPFNGSGGKVPYYSLTILSNPPSLPESQFLIPPDLSVTRQLIQQCGGWIAFEEHDALELDHMNRIHLFNQWLISAVRVLNPFSTYCSESDEFYSTPEIIEALGGDSPHILQGIVALKKSAPGVIPAVLTCGMASVGLPEFRVLESEGLAEGEVADLLWNYAYSTYQNGDIWRTGSPIMGPREGERWYCTRSEVEHSGTVMITTQSIQ